MKIYGAKKATEFNKGQIGLIYRMAKSGEINLEKWVANDFYKLADYYGFDDNGSVAIAERKILKIIDAAAINDTATVQELVDKYTFETWNLLGRKTKEQCNREFV